MPRPNDENDLRTSYASGLCEPPRATRTAREDAALHLLRPFPLLAPALGCAAVLLANHGFRRSVSLLTVALAAFLASLFWQVRKVMTTAQRLAAVGGVAMVVLGGLLAMSGTAVADEDESHAVSLRVWENQDTGERYAELVPYGSPLQEQLGAGTVYVYFNPETLTAVVDRHGLAPEGVDLVEVPVDQHALHIMLDALDSMPFSAEREGGADGCAISCYELRRTSAAYHSIYKTSLDASQDAALSDGAVVTGTALLGFAAGSLLTTTTTVGSGGIAVVSGALSSNPAGWTLFALGAVVVAGGAAIHYMNQRDEARFAAEAWAANPANGCPGCGYVNGTFGWWYDSPADMCVNPECSSPPCDQAPDATAPGVNDEVAASGSSVEVGGGSDDSHSAAGGGNPLGGFGSGVVSDDSASPCADGELIEESGLSCAAYCESVNDNTFCDACVVESGLAWSICSEGVGETEPEDTESESE